MDRCSKPLRVAFVGVSAHAEEHLLPCLLLNPGYRLICVASRDADKSARLQQRFGFERQTGSWQEAVDADDVDVGFVAAAPDFHLAVMERCIRRGLPLFVEKPSAPSLECLVRLLDITKKHPANKTFVGYNFRYAPAFVEFLRLADASGERRAVTIRCLANKPQVPYWNYKSNLESFLFAIGIHALDAAVHISGDPTFIRASCSFLNERQFCLQVQFKGARGVLSAVELGNYGPRFAMECGIVTSSGMRLEMDLALPGSMRIIGSDEGKFAEHYHRIRRSPDDRDGFGYQSELESFRRSIVEATPLCSPVENDLSVFRLIENILDQVQSGGLV